jgi:sterol desaturase/sphingolipid hydroxylase (fatty acid hydroxylase superfamily)
MDDRTHRFHHSLEPKHFGLFITLWDSLFGTAYFPEPGEWPQTGVADFPEPQTVGEFLLAPFTHRPSRETASQPVAEQPAPASS